MIIYHNPRCTKSRQALQLLSENGVSPDVILYLDQTLTAEDLRKLLTKLGIPAVDLIRKGEQVFKDNYKGKELNEEEWIDAMVAYPKLIERPIVVKGKKAVIGRPTEKILELL